MVVWKVIIMKENETTQRDYELKVEPRKNGEFLNLYLYIDGKRFELVPHCRSIRETAYFYGTLARSSLALNK